MPAGFLENEETVEEGALRESWEEARARSEKIKLFMMCNLPHISQIYMIYHGFLVDGKYDAGPESSEVKLFSEKEIPWADIAFPVVKSTLEHYFQDLQSNNFPVRMFDVLHGEDRSITTKLISLSNS